MTFQEQADGRNRKIRVAMVILEYDPIIGGAQRQLALLAPHLWALGVEISVLTRRYPGLAAFEEIDGVPVHRLPAPGPKAAASLVYSAASLRRLGQLRPDVVHAFSLFSPLTTAVVYKAFSGTPVAVKVLRGGRLGDVYRLRHKFLGRRRLDLFRHSVDAFIAISREIEAELAGAEIEEPRRPYIPNGVDTGHYQPVTPQARAALKARLGLPAGPLTAYTGRLVPEKRVDLLLDAWPVVRQAHPSATLAIVGSGEEAGRLRTRAGEGVIFTGGVADVQPYLQAADLFVLPSSDEGLSNALLEAMAAGLAVVATSVGGAPDLIEHQANGWLVPPGDQQALRDSLIHLLANPDSRQALGQSARSTVVAGFALPVIARQLRGLYDELMTR